MIMFVIDDRSRLVCHLQRYLDETAQSLIHCLCQALMHTTFDPFVVGLTRAHPTNKINDLARFSPPGFLVSVYDVLADVRLFSESRM
jgi:hypothetical protein